MEGNYEGYFWEPDRSGTPLRGRLTWAASQGGDLVLEGAIVGSDVLPKHDLLLGRTLDGTPIVLFDAFAYHFSFASRETQRWRINRALVGTSDPQPAVSAGSLRLDGLRLFYGQTGISVVGPTTSQGPVTISWTPDSAVTTVPLPEGELRFATHRELDVSDDVAQVRHDVSLECTPRRAAVFSEPSEALHQVAALIEFLADRPFQVARETFTDCEGYEVDYLYRPVLGVSPDRPDRFWLRFDDVQPNLAVAVARWTELSVGRREMVDLLVEEVRFSRRTNTIDRVLRLSRIVELLHRARHPDAVPPVSDETERIEIVLREVGEENRRWLAGRLGRDQVRLRQRVAELIADLDGSLDAALVEPDEFAAMVTRTRNWHTHYTNNKGTAAGFDSHTLAMRLWLVVRASILVELGWTAQEAGRLIAKDPYVAWLADRPLLTSDG